MITIKTMSEVNTKEEIKQNSLNRIEMIYKEMMNLAANTSIRIAPRIRLIEVNLDELKKEINLL